MHITGRENPGGKVFAPQYFDSSVVFLKLLEIKSKDGMDTSQLGGLNK